MELQAGIQTPQGYCFKDTEVWKKGSGETNKWKVQWLYKQCAWEV